MIIDTYGVSDEVSMYAQAIQQNTLDITPKVQTQSVRSILGTYDTALHAKGQVRTGYITMNR